MLVRGFVMFVLVIIGGNVWADCKDEMQIEYGLKSHHWISDPDLMNEDNNFVGISIGCFTGSSFINSLFDQTYTLGYKLEYNRNIGMGLGLIKGYESKYFASQFRVSEDTIWYASPEITIWGDQIPELSEVPFASNVGVKWRQFGEVSQVLVVITKRY